MMYTELRRDGTLLRSTFSSRKIPWLCDFFVSVSLRVEIRFVYDSVKQSWTCNCMEAFKYSSTRFNRNGLFRSVVVIWRKELSLIHI